jgi:hypothetical protein
MKSLLSFYISFVFCLTGFCQEPESFNYQTIVHNTAGEVVATHAVSIKISILAGSDYDSIFYSEKHDVTTNRLGLVSISIGSGVDKTGNLSSLDWSADKYFLKVEMDVSGGTNYTEMGITQILNMPYTSPSKKPKRTSATIAEDKLVIKRKYVGQFEDYRLTGPETNDGPYLIWIKTSLDKTFGKISAYGKKCGFSVGDRLYIKRKYYTPGGVFGFWVYGIENDSSIYYKVTDFQHDRKVSVETWFK